jgi:iron complex transport system permease protein
LNRLKNRLPFIIFLFIVIAMLGFLSLLMGTSRISAPSVFLSIFSPSSNPNVSMVIWQERMPRLMLEVLSGGLLALAGSILLGIFGSRIVDNPAVKSLYAIDLIAAVIFTVMIILGMNVRPLYPLLLGTLAGTTWNKVLFASIFITAGLIVYVFYYKDMNALAFGEYTAKTLGVETEEVRFFLFLITIVISAVAVYACGIMCLAGLIFPYFIRLVAGVNYKYLIPVSILATASLMIFVDIFSRIIFPTEFPLGIMMVALSVPFFVNALHRRRLGL